jgi:hypothetical protein
MTTVIAFKPKAPKMGGLFQVSSTDWCACTKGKPLYDWFALDQIVVKEPNNNFQYHPSSPGSSQKSTAYREVDLETKFKRDDHLLDFAEVIEEYFLRTDLDTITYQPDPQDPQIMLSVLKHFAKFDLQAVIDAGRLLHANEFGRYDRNNADSACKWLKNSMDPALKEDVCEMLKPTDGFTAHLMPMIRLVQSTYFNRFQAIKHEIENELTSIFQFPGQSVKDLARAFIIKAKEACTSIA